MTRSRALTLIGFAVLVAAANCRKVWPVIGLLLMSLNGCGSADRTVLQEISEKVYTVEPDANISIYNRDGAILVYGSNGNEVRVQSLKKAYSQERLNQIAIDVSARPDAVSITAKFPPPRNWTFSDRSGAVDFTVVVPVTASISALDLNTGEVLLDSVRGQELHARLGDGRMFARNCFANVDLTMNRGTLTVSYDWWENEKFSAEAKIGQGNAWVFLPADASFHLRAYAAHGKIASDFHHGPLPANSSARGPTTDQIINGGSATLGVQVKKGDIKIAKVNP